jgi:hypothetical protein
MVYRQRSASKVVVTKQATPAVKPLPWFVAPDLSWPTLLLCKVPLL